MVDFFGMEKAQMTSDDSFPLTLSKINQAQKADKSLLRLVQSSDQYALRTFRRGETSFELIVRFDKIVIPKSLQSRTVEWYHYYLCHPGETRTEQTIRQHFWWNNLRDTVHTVCKTCDTCQRTKKTNMKCIQLAYQPFPHLLWVATPRQPSLPAAQQQQLPQAPSNGQHSKHLKQPVTHLLWV